MTHTTIQRETIDVLSRAALTSARVHYVSEAIKNTDTSFEIIRILTSALISAEQEVNVHRDQHIRLREMSLTPSMFLDSNQKFIGVDVAKTGSDTQIYNLPPYQIEIQNKILDAIGNYRMSHHGEYPCEIKVSGRIYTVIRNNQYYYTHEENQFDGIPVLLYKNAPEDFIEVS